MHTAWSRCRESYPFCFSAHTPILSLLSGCPHVSPDSRHFTKACPSQEIGPGIGGHIRLTTMMEKQAKLWMPALWYPLDGSSRCTGWSRINPKGQQFQSDPKVGLDATLAGHAIYKEQCRLPKGECVGQPGSELEGSQEPVQAGF